MFPKRARYARQNAGCRQGPLWTGDQAVKIGLVDELGGYDVALAAIRTKLGLGKDDPLKLQVFPAPESPVEKAFKWLKNVDSQSAMMARLCCNGKNWRRFSGRCGAIWR